MQDRPFNGDQFRKIKFASSTKETTVEWREPIGDQDDEQVRTMPDIPHEDLRDALDRLKKQYLEVMELPETAAPKVTIVGLQVKMESPRKLKLYGKRDLTGVGKTIGQPTPAVPAINEGIKDVVREVVVETMKMVQGKRDQLDLFEEQPDVQDGTQQTVPDNQQLPQQNTSSATPAPTA